MVKGEWNLIFFHYVRKNANEFLTSKHLLHLFFQYMYIYWIKKNPEHPFVSANTVLRKLFKCPLRMDNAFA